MGNQLSVNYPEHNNPSSSQRRELYLMATRRRVDVNRGTPYPCTQADLDSCARLASRNNAQYITPNLATNELVRWLDHDPDAVAVAALHRLRKGLKIIPWNPDIIIKAFRDLDAAFFKCTLIGNTELAWVGKTARLLRFGFMSCWGTTIKIGHARCRIELNAYKILLETNPYQQMWRTLLHEMVHAYLFVKCGHCHQLKIDLKLPTWGDGHGTHFRRCIHMVTRRAEAYLGIDAICPLNDDYRYHY